MSGKKARAERQNARQAGNQNELHALATLLQWGILPAGPCGRCGGASPDLRALATLMGPVPTHDARPGNPADEAAADARFRQLAEQQARGEYAIGALYAVCVPCASAILASVPDAIGNAQALTRRAMAPVGLTGTDGVFMHGEPGADKSLRWSIRTVFAGELLPILEANCRDAAAAYLRDTPRHVFGWAEDGAPDGGEGGGHE